MVEDERSNLFGVEVIDLNNSIHVNAFLSLMNDYMLDDMGLNSSLPSDLGDSIINGLLEQSNYIGFLLKHGTEFVALANCFVSFSTFKAKRLINIHDFIVSPQKRNMGAGRVLLNAISNYGLQRDCCKITLEVRYDNNIAQSLYRNVGFTDCNPPMHFWQKVL